MPQLGTRRTLKWATLAASALLLTAWIGSWWGTPVLTAPSVEGGYWAFLRNGNLILIREAGNRSWATGWQQTLRYAGDPPSLFEGPSFDFSIPPYFNACVPLWMLGIPLVGLVVWTWRAERAAIQ